MELKPRKRALEDVHGHNGDEAPLKRRRQINEEQLKLSKLYENLAAESDEVRIDAAKQLIVKFSAENKPAAYDVKSAINRLIKGLCSQRKAARVGFSLTLTELLRQLFGQDSNPVADSDLRVASIIKLVEENTKVEGNVPGKARRDHLIGRLFGYKAVLQSSIVIEPEVSMECWTTLLDHIYGMARDIPWLREECGMILIEAVKSLQGQAQYEECAKEMIARLSTHKLVSTPEGVAIWLTVQVNYDNVLTEGIWHKKDPLSKRERSRLAKILKENYQGASEKGNNEAIKTAAANPNPTFAWDLILSEVLSRDDLKRRDSGNSSKPEFPQFWLDTVDNNLFTSTSSHERKAWGFKLLSSMIFRIPESVLSALFSPNLMRTLINQSKKEDRYLHSAAVAALKSIQAKAQHEATSALPIFIMLTTTNGCVDFDRLTKTKTLEQLLLSADDSTLKKMVRHLNSLILRPESDEQAAADSRRQIIADLLLNTVKHYKRYRDLPADAADQDGWLKKTLEVLIEYAYFVPSQSAKTSKVPLPLVSEGNRQMFQERLSSCLTRLLDVGGGSRSTFAASIVSMIKSKLSSSKSLDLAFSADESVMQTIEKAFQTLDAISVKGSSAGNESATEGFILLYSLTLLQVYNGEGDAVMMLDDLDASREGMIKDEKDATQAGSDTFVEIVLSFLGNPRTLFRKIGVEAFSIFVAEIGSVGLQSLTDILDTEESLEGQRELFNQDHDDDDDAAEGQSSGDSDNDSDVEMVDGEEQDSEDAGSGTLDSDDMDDEDDNGSDNDNNSEDDAELVQFNNMLAMTLQTSKPGMNSDVAEDTSDGSDMDDDQMMALDQQLSKIFQQRNQITSKKKDREGAKQNMVQFKSRVLDLLAIYLEKQYSNPLTLDLLLPILRRTRASANKQLAEKASKLLKAHLGAQKKQKAPLPRPVDVDAVLAVLRAIHEEAKLGGGAKMHADTCSSVSLFLVKVLIGLDRGNYSGVVDIYAETQKQWFMDRKSPLQPALFLSFQNWSLNARQQSK